MKPETVAIVTLLDKRKRGLLPLLLPRWEAIDLMGRERRYVAVTTDADAETIDEFVALLPGRDVRLLEADVDPMVPHIEHLKDMKPMEAYGNIVFLHRMALLREAARQGVLALKPRPKWTLWLDQDIDPRTHAFRFLHEILTANRGPQRPRVACGLYCTRNQGQNITQWLDGGEATRYIDIIPDAVQATQVAGFGCVLMPTSVLAEIGWEHYGDYRADRNWQVEIGRKDAAGILGEDIYWLRRQQQWSGVPPVTDNRVRCRHYHADGSYFKYEVEGEPPRLKAVFYRDEAQEALGVRVRNVGGDPWCLPRYGLRVEGGAEAVVSPEICSELKQLFATSLQEVAT